MNADHSIACGVFTNDDGRCTCKEDSARVRRPAGTRALVTSLWPLRKYAGARIHLRGVLRWRELPPDPEGDAYWNDPVNRRWARHSSVYDDRGGC